MFGIYSPKGITMNTVIVCYKYYLVRWLKNIYELVEIHCILAKADAYLILGGSILVSDNTSLLNLVKAALRLRSCHSLLK